MQRNEKLETPNLILARALNFHIKLNSCAGSIGVLVRWLLRLARRDSYIYILESADGVICTV